MGGPRAARASPAAPQVARREKQTNKQKKRQHQVRAWVRAQTYRWAEVVVRVPWGVGGGGREVRAGRAGGQVRSGPSGAGGQVGGGGVVGGRTGTTRGCAGGLHAGGARGPGGGAAPPTRLGRGGGTRVTLQNTKQKQTKQNEGRVHIKTGIKTHRGPGARPSGAGGRAPRPQRHALRRNGHGAAASVELGHRNHT